MCPKNVPPTVQPTLQRPKPHKNFGVVFRSTQTLGVVAFVRCAALRGLIRCGLVVCAVRAGCTCKRRLYHAFDGGIFRVGGDSAFFWDQLNVHTFNCRHLADRRVEGLDTEVWV